MMKSLLIFLMLLTATLLCHGEGTRPYALIVGQPSIFWRDGEWQIYQDGQWVPYSSENKESTSITEQASPEPVSPSEPEMIETNGYVTDHGWGYGVPVFGRTHRHHREKFPHRRNRKDEDRLSRGGGLGQTTIGIGRQSGGLGQPTIGIGQRNGLGQPTIGIGQQNGGLGQTTIGIGEANFRIGQRNVAIGQPNGQLGQPTIDIGQPIGAIGQTTIGIGQPTIGIGRQMGGIGRADDSHGRR